MSAHRVITLLTDFGMRDTYVGIMKGVILRINPYVHIIDITHEIPPHTVEAANFNLMTAYRYFPPDTIHVAIVDPGVGSKRRALAIESTHGIFIGPDNGIFTGVLTREHCIVTVELNNPSYWLTEKPSTTFHGRDIFAPVAAHLAGGVPLRNMGTEINPDSLIYLKQVVYKANASSIIGTVQYIDRFGNLITNIPAEAVRNKQWNITVGGITINAYRTYSDTKQGNLLALEGSHGFLEIAVHSGSAESVLGVGYGAPVQVNIVKKRGT